MSGIAGIVNVDGAPIDRELLTAMTASLRFRGPDAERVWIDGHVGFGHTLLVTTDEGWKERQPCTLDGDVWIVADARIDAREDLVRDLRAQGKVHLEAGAAGGANDAELLLHAYAAWGEACVDHLIGDFAFAIWDGRARRLFCARDHFGVKPFFYACCRGSLVLSNTLACVRRHPAVSDRLNDLAVADFLLFKYNQEADTTAFADIRRLPAAHCLSWSPGAAPVVRRYWSLPLDREIRYRRGHEYVERFRELLTIAVRDRLRTRRVAVSMSGGLDSSMLAATARAILSADGEPFDLRAHTIVFDSLMPDEERKYAGIVADALRMPIEFFAADAYEPFERCDEPACQLPEPGTLAFRALGLDFDRQIAAHSRVVLSGTDADALLNELTGDHLAALARKRRFGELSATVARYVLWLRRRPPLGLREKARRWLGYDGVASEMPRWINPELIARLDLEQRWRDVELRRAMRPGLRPRAEVSIGWWSQVFEAGDAAITRQPLEYRYPFADVRLAGYLVAIPAVPWCTDKTLLRMALTGVLPEAIRRRKKTPVAGDHFVTTLRRDSEGRIDRVQPDRSLADYVRLDAIPPMTGHSADGSAHVTSRPLNLNWWLRSHLLGAEDGQRQEYRSRSVV
jgi:asparagine synthase (glutamine-hydrolysing)